MEMEDSADDDLGIGSYLIELTTYPEQLRRIASDIGFFMSNLADKTVFIDVAGLIFAKGASLGPPYASIVCSLFNSLKHTAAVQLPGGMMFTFKEALSSIVSKRFKNTQQGLEDFEMKLPLMFEVFNTNLQSWGILNNHMKSLAKGNSEFDIAFQLMILQQLDLLRDRGVSTFHDSKFKSYLKDLKRYLDENLASNSHQIAVITCLLQKHGIIQAPPPGSGDARNLLSRTNPNMHQSIAVEPQLVTSNERRSVVIADPSTAPICYDQPNSCNSCPVLVKQEAEMCSLSSPSSSRSIRIVRLESRPLPPSLVSTPVQQQAEPAQQTLRWPDVRSVMIALSRDPGNLQAAVEDIKALFCTKDSFKAVFQDVYDILHAACYASSDDKFAVCVKVIEKLLPFEIELKGFPKISVRSLVLKCASNIQKLENVGQVKQFCTSFRLTNELYRIGAAPRDVFNFYVNNLGKGSDEISLTVLLEVMRNLDKLVDAKIAQLDSNELQFWSGESNRLRKQLDKGNTLFSQTFVTSATEFLSALNKKGGWKRQTAVSSSKKTPPSKPAANAHKVTSASALTPTAISGKGKSAPAPSAAPSQTLALTKTSKPASTPPPAPAVPTPQVSTLAPTPSPVPTRTEASSNPPNFEAASTEQVAVPIIEPEANLFIESEQSLPNKEMAPEQSQNEKTPSASLKVTEQTSVTGNKISDASKSENEDQTKKKAKDIDLSAESVQSSQSCNVEPMQESSPISRPPPPLLAPLPVNEEPMEVMETEKSQNDQSASVSHETLPDDSISVVLQPQRQEPSSSRSKAKQSTSQVADRGNSSSHEHHHQQQASAHSKTNDGDGSMVPSIINVRALSKVLLLVDKSVDPLRKKLQNTNSVFAFSSAIESIMSKVFEQIDDDNTLKAAATVCEELSKIDFGRGKDFKLTLENFFTLYAGGKNSSDLEKLQQSIQERRQLTSSEFERRSLAEKALNFEKIYLKRRSGSTRLVGKLFLQRFLSVKFIARFADALLVSADEPAFECLKQLFTDVGCQFGIAIRLAGMEEWFGEYFDEVMAVGMKESSSEHLKQIIRAIILGKSQWWDIESRGTIGGGSSAKSKQTQNEGRGGAKGGSDFALNDLIQRTLSGGSANKHSRDQEESFSTLLTKVYNPFVANKQSLNPVTIDLAESDSVSSSSASPSSSRSDHRTPTPPVSSSSLLIVQQRESSLTGDRDRDETARKRQRSRSRESGNSNVNAKNRLVESSSQLEQ